MARKDYRPGDIIYLGKDTGGKIALVPVLLVTLISVSLDGELWKVRNPESGDLDDHFIQYPDDDDDPDRLDSHTGLTASVFPGS